QHEEAPDFLESSPHLTSEHLPEPPQTATPARHQVIMDAPVRSSIIDTILTLSLRAFVLIGGTKIALALLGFAVGAQPSQASPVAPVLGVSLMMTLAFSASAVLLLFGGRRDQRAMALGAAFLGIATAFGTRGVDRLLAVLEGPFRWPLKVIDTLPLDA